MAGFEAQRETLEGLGASIVAASIDTGENAQKIADTINYPLGVGVTREMAGQLDAWWEDRRSIIQPSNFILDANGAVKVASYADGPIGRIDPEEAVRFIQFLESQS